MKQILQKLTAYQTLSHKEAEDVMLSLGRGEFSQSHMTAFLTVFMMRSITLEELQGFVDALLSLCISVDLGEDNTIDLCGTGGDGKDTFNISTTSAFVVSGAGQKVAKHGNYGISSSCGSSTVMEFLGASFTSDQEWLIKQIQRSNICFLHAPLFHPAMKHVGPIRKELGLKTFFNMLGPLVNPAFPSRQVTGVFNLELARMYGYLAQKGGKNFTIIHDLMGYDEVSLTGPVKLVSSQKDTVVTPEELGFTRLNATEIAAGKDVQESALILTQILQNAGTKSQTDVVLANAGLALTNGSGIPEWKEGIERARASIESGAAWNSFQKFFSNQPS